MPLSRYRIVEWGTGSSVAYCGKILAGFGADVIKIEGAGGDPGRTEPPFLETAAGSESAIFAWLNTNKRTVALDLTQEADRAVLLQLLEGADILLDARASEAAEAGPLSPEALARSHPHLIVTAISWFGESGPYRNFHGSDLACRALAGLVSLVGTPEKPVAISDHQADIVAGLTACVATLAGLYSGVAGRRFSVSVHESCVPLADAHVGYGARGVRARQGYNRFPNWGPSGIFPCREGWIGIAASTPDQWQAFCDLFDMADMAADPRFTTLDGRAAHADAIEARFAHRLTERTAEAWFAEARRRKLPFAVVPDMATLLQQSVHRDNGSLATIRVGDTVFEAPALPMRLPKAPQAAVAIATPLTPSPMPVWRARDTGSPVDGARADCSARPLAALKLVDLSMGWAGPLATRMLADLGAEVVKVESCRYPDWWRGSDRRAAALADRAYEKRPNYLLLNRGKLGITLDLTKPDGAALLKRLLARADALIENYSSEVLPKLHLDYPHLAATKDDLVMVSMPAFPSGAFATARAYGATLEQASGLPTLAGEEGQPPMMSHYAFGDSIGGLNAAVTLLLAVLHRRNTGEGQHVELSQVQCMLPLAASGIIAQAVTGRPAPRRGSRHLRHVPHDFFPCSGADAWVLIGVEDDAMWIRLWHLMRPGEALDPALATAEQRREREDAIGAWIERWTRARTADDAMLTLQGAGIVAAAVRSPFDLIQDPHLVARGCWQPVDRAWSGRHQDPSLPIREGEAPYAVMHPAPTLGEYNGAVLGGLLGLTDADLERLTAAKIIGTEAVPATLRSAAAPVGVPRASTG